MQEEDIYYNNGNIENDSDNKRYRENMNMNMNRFYNPNENYNMNKRENNNINNIMINENIRQTRQNFNDNIGLMFNRNLNQIQEPKENNAQYQPQNTNYHQSIPSDINPNWVPNFIPILVGIPLHLDSRLPFQNNLGLPPNLISQIPAPNYLSQNQIIPNMVPYQIQNNQSRFEIRENNEINRNNMQLNEQDNSNGNIIYFPKYKSNLDFRNLYLPNIRNRILNVAQNYNYNLTEKEKRMLFDDNIVLSSDTIFINEYMFYSPYRISLYAPHIIRARNDITSLLLSKDLNFSDFQYAEYYEKNNNFTFLMTLLKSIKEYNDDDNDYNEKIFGFDFNVKNNYYYLYSTIDEDIISNKLKENHQNQNDKDFEELTFEELIIYMILERLKFKYELLPRIIYYEYYLTINGDRVIFGNNDHPTGYSYIDYVIYSKCDCIYNKNESPLIIKERYKLNSMENEVEFEIKKDTLYFFILQSSLGSINKGNNFFGELFQKYEEFANLYKSREWISDKTQKEIMLIFENHRSDLIYSKYGKIIGQFLMENKDCSLNIVYSKKSYCFLPQDLSMKKYNEVKNENENLKKEIDKLNQKLNEMEKKYEKIESK